jgi:hypothetical protein
LISSFVRRLFAPAFIRLWELPFITKWRKWFKITKLYKENGKSAGRLLTACGIALVEDCCYLWIKLDLVFLLAPQIMPLVHSLLDPSLENFSDQCVDHIAYVRSRKLHYLSFDHRKRLHHLLIIGSKLKHGFDFESLEVRNGDRLDICRFDSPSLPARKITHMKYGHRLIGAQVCAAVVGEEPVYFSLALELGGESCCVYLHWSSILLLPIVVILA